MDQLVFIVEIIGWLLWLQSSQKSFLSSKPVNFSAQLRTFYLKWVTAG